jgi:enoyl-[acyl-carrier-protein] reductase (NADH)
MKSDSIKSSLVPMLLGVSLLSLTGCTEKPKGEIKTLETMKANAAVKAYDATGSDAAKMEAEKSFIALDQEIKELEIRVDATTGEKRAVAAEKLALLKKREDELRSEFNQAKFNTLVEDVKNSVR